MQRLMTLLLLAVASQALISGGGLAHPLDNANLPPTAARPDIRAAGLAGSIAQQLLANEGRSACCVKPICGMCRQNGAACPCAATLFQGKGVCGECWEGWQNGLGLFPTINPKELRLHPFPARDEAYQKSLPPTAATKLLAQERKALDNAKRTMFQEGRYACCVRPGCDSCARAGGCPCGANLAAGEGVCGECVGGWHAGHGAFGGIQAADVKLEPPAVTAAGAGAGHGAGAGMAVGASVMPPAGILSWTQRQSEASLAALDRVTKALSEAGQARDTAAFSAAMARARREAEETRARVSHSLYSMKLVGDLETMEAAATGVSAPSTPAAREMEATRVAGQRSTAAAAGSLARVVAAIGEAQRSTSAGRAGALARAQVELQAVKALIGQSLQSMGSVKGKRAPAAEAERPPEAETPPATAPPTTGAP